VPDFLDVLGSLKELHIENDLNISMFFCGRTSCLSTRAKWPQGPNPFIGVPRDIHLEPLSRADSSALVKVLGVSANLEFTAEALDEIHQATDGHPHFTRTICSQVFEQPLPSPDVQTGIITVTQKEIRAARVWVVTNPATVNLLYTIYADNMDTVEQVGNNLCLRNGRYMFLTAGFVVHLWCG
jgi:hypothetical protein